MRLIFPFLLLSFFLNAQEFTIEEIAANINKIKTSNILSPRIEYELYDPFATAKPILKEKKVIHKSKPKAIDPQTILNGEVFIEKKMVCYR
jgi:hypothetical protein